MNNYEYIVASLPVLSSDYRGEIDCEDIEEQIREQLSAKDRKALDDLCASFEGSNLCADFYAQALKSKCRFIREYLAWDLDVRNCKVEWLNRQLGRKPLTDVVSISEEPREFPQESEVMAALEVGDLIQRERNIDELMWGKIDEISQMQIFTLDAILGFVAKMHIIKRWITLDPETGRKLFAQLVDEIRNNKKPIE